MENSAECNYSDCSIPDFSNSLSPEQSEGDLLKKENTDEASKCSPNATLLKIEDNSESDGSSCSPALTQPERILQMTENIEGCDQPGNSSSPTVGHPEGILHLLDKLESIIDKLLPG